MSNPAATTSEGLRTPSLRRRVTLVVLALIALMLLVLGVTTDRVLESRLDAQLRQRLVDRAGVAEALVDQVDTRDLARRLEGDGVSAVLTDSDGNVYAEGPLAGGAAARQGGADESAAPEPPGTAPDGRPGPADPPAPAPKKAAVVQEGDLLSIDRELSDGTRLVLVADARDIGTTLDQVRLALVLAALLVLVVAGVAVPLVVGRALHPLGRITEVARSITRGDRQRRLDPTHPGSDLGATAAAFDEMLDEIVGAERRAVGSEQQVRDFLSDAAHDLRTPLTGVLGATEHVLRDDPPRPEREQVLLTVIRETRRASRLVDDMLLMATIDQGLSLVLAPVDLAEVVAHVATAHELADRRPPLEVETVPSPVLGDRDRLARVLTNLLQNAQQVGASRVMVSSRPDPLRHEVVVEVADDGPGVPASERERIFDRLVRLDPARSAHAGGSGLGLSIARGIARAHGGDLQCVAPTGPGALFRLTVPASD